MLKFIIATLILLSSSAFAGIIGVGGTNANENPEVLDALNRSVELSISDADLRRLSIRIDNAGIVNQELTTTGGQKIRKDFIKVYHNSQAKIVDSEITVKLAPEGPWRN